MDPISELIGRIRKHANGANISDLDICPDDVPWICKDGDYIRITTLDDFSDVTVTTYDMLRTFCEAHKLDEPLRRLNSDEHMVFDASVEHPDLGIIRIHAHRSLSGKQLNI